jgi:hypothetical protein
MKMSKYKIFRKDYASLKDYQLAYGKAYRETNRQQINSMQKELRKNNPEKLKAYNKKAYNKNIEKIKLYNKEFYKAHVEKMYAKNKAYREANREKVYAYNKKYKENNPEKIKAWQKEYREKNRGVFRAIQAKRRARNLQATPAWVNLEAIKKIYTQCPKGYHVDHIVPLQGKNVCGFHVENNLQYLKADENIRKGNR